MTATATAAATSTTPTNTAPYQSHYRPEHGSAAYRMCVWALDNRDELLTAKDIGIKFDLTNPRSAHSVLERSIAAQLLRCEVVDGINHYGAGPAIHMLHTWPQTTAGLAVQQALAAAPAASAAKSPCTSKANSKRGGKQKRLPILDIHAIPVSYDVPVPPRKGGIRGESYWHALFKRLDKPGASAQPIDNMYRASLVKILVAWTKAYPDQRIETRPVSDTSFGLWRIK